MGNCIRADSREEPYDLESVVEQVDGTRKTGQNHDVDVAMNTFQCSWVVVFAGIIAHP